MASQNLSPGAGNGGARIGRPPLWTDSKSRKLARLYVYTTLPVEKIIKAVFPDDSVKYDFYPSSHSDSISTLQQKLICVSRKNSAQKTMHKMFGQDPRSLRPANRAEMNSRFKLVHNRSRKGRKGSSPTEQEFEEVVLPEEMKTEEANTPAYLNTGGFDDRGFMRSPQQESIYSMGSELASPSTLASQSPIGPHHSVFSPDVYAHPFQGPFSPPSRNDTVFSSSTEMSTDSVRSMRERLAVTTIFAKQVTVLMKRLTIGGSEEHPMPSPHRTPSDIATSRRGHPSPVPHPGLAVPGDFLVARRYVQPCQVERHFATQLQGSMCACWCTIADDVSDDTHDSFYMTRGEECCDVAAGIVKSGQAAARYVDHFGNTPLHLFAALESQKGIDTTFQLLQTGQADPLAVNHAGQTFLHVLSAAWFVKSDDNNVPFYRLLNLLWRPGFIDAVFIRDVYGRTFFHQLGRFTDNVQDFADVAKHYPSGTIPRDAFGIVPPTRLAADHPFSAPRQVGTTPLSPLAEEDDIHEFATRDQKLLDVVQEAYKDPKYEDQNGRNGLHCLAEMRFDTPPSSTPTSPVVDQPAGNGNKRKRGKDAADKPRAIERRADLLEGLLTPVTNVPVPDVNHYDKQGLTVLMAFAISLSDDQDKQGQHIGKIIDFLLDRGANIEARNRRGETALLMATRYGNKHVVSKLLERGANIHARDIKGQGIMGVLDMRIAQSSSHLQSYGRLEAVRGMLAKKFEETGAEDDPSLWHEWGGQARGPHIQLTTQQAK
ncbi:ankyrin [Cryphonectria parasitica EP155]|uniref:Ankyrin n=1 Tax=Cryphonectria parasitica (strain ATCC 38755 / EP155) TaxID=660469 RepID=A0A9P4Y3H4_CRYP1|nr:ankyrin [Cryphonectria parasitica EP155]KAF3766003.1 ankyrin [Cryphonectria parasitica EP155]